MVLARQCHPAPFPVELVRRCVSATPGGVVLDPLLGNGTTAIAAESCGKEWIGMHYEHKKHDGSLPVIGVNTFTNPDAAPPPAAAQLVRSSEAEKQSQIKRLRAFHARHAEASAAALERVKQAALAGENIFAELVEAVKVCSLGQLSDALHQVGGRYRRNV